MSSHLGKAIKNKVTNAVGTAIAAPAIAKGAISSAISNHKYNKTVGMRNFKNRTDDSNKYRSTSYWAKNKN